jgi:hypothetical protein
MASASVGHSTGWRCLVLARAMGSAWMAVVISCLFALSVGDCWEGGSLCGILGVGMQTVYLSPGHGGYVVVLSGFAEP